VAGIEPAISSHEFKTS